MVVMYQPDIRSDRDKKLGFYNGGERNGMFYKSKERQNSHDKSGSDKQEQSSKCELSFNTPTRHLQPLLTGSA